MLQASDAFKEALGKYAQAHGLSMAEVIRRGVAVMINYDLASEPPRATGGRKIYASAEERAKAALERAKVRREIEKQIRAALDKNDFETAKSLNEELKDS